MNNQIWISALVGLGPSWMFSPDVSSPTEGEIFSGFLTLLERQLRVRSPPKMSLAYKPGNPNSSDLKTYVLLSK